MKFLFILMFSSIFIFRGLSQCTYDDYYAFISDSCYNCSTGVHDKLIGSLFDRSDSILANTQKQFFDKVDTSKDISVGKKIMVKKRYSSMLKSLKKTRYNIFSNYYYLKKHVFNDGYVSLFYWYFTDQMIATLKDIERTLIGEKD